MCLEFFLTMLQTFSKYLDELRLTDSIYLKMNSFRLTRLIMSIPKDGT